MNTRRFLTLAIGLALFGSQILSAEEVVLRVLLLQGTRDEGKAGVQRTLGLTAADHPALASLKKRAAVSESSFKAAVVEALMETADLKTADVLFSFAKKWNDGEPDLTDTVKLERTAFRFEFGLHRLAPQRLSVRMTLFKTREIPLSGRALAAEMAKILIDGDQMEKILDREAMFDLGDPSVFEIPAGSGYYFLALHFMDATPNKDLSEPRKANPSAPESSLEPLKAIRQVLPFYPEELRRAGVEGAVELQIAIDEEGTVRGVKVLKSLHPYLDYTAVQALRQWTYVPVLQNGNPVPVYSTVIVNFTREAYRQAEELSLTQIGRDPTPELGYEPTLRQILDRCAEYCRKVINSALDFICEETIEEIHYRFGPDTHWSGVAVSPKGGNGVPYVAFWIPTFDPQRTEKNVFVCDYLFVKNADRIDQRRIILRDNGRALPDRNRLLEGKTYSALMPLMASVNFLRQDYQSLYHYRILAGERIKGKKAHVLEAMPRYDDARSVQYAKIWVDQVTSQILQSEVEGVPLMGFDDVLEDATRFNTSPVFTVRHVYQTEKNGVLFPSQSTVRVGYPRSDNPFDGRMVKLKMELGYKKYKFFAVETENRVIK
jgi:TonB family protein